MLFKRTLYAAFALAILISATGCGCRKSCMRSSASFAPPPCGSCANIDAPPPGLVPVR